jgi:hypothetical protein
MRARHRLSKLLLGHGIVYYDGQAWTGKHDVWLRHDARTRLAAAAGRASTMTFEFDYDNVLASQARRDRLNIAIEQMATASEFTPLVRRLGCLRGISTLTGFGLAVEIGDWHRFTGNTIGSFVGLVPSEYSSGQSRVQGMITKTGNTHVRRLLIEAAWHHRARYHIGAVMRARWEQAPPEARERGDRGNRRLHARWVRFIDRRKRSTIANVAIVELFPRAVGPLAVADRYEQVARGLRDRACPSRIVNVTGFDQLLGQPGSVGLPSALHRGHVARERRWAWCSVSGTPVCRSMYPYWPAGLISKNTHSLSGVITKSSAP